MHTWARKQAPPPYKLSARPPNPQTLSPKPAEPPFEAKNLPKSSRPASAQGALLKGPYSTLMRKGESSCFKRLSLSWRSGFVHSNAPPGSHQFSTYHEARYTTLLKSLDATAPWRKHRNLHKPPFGPFRCLVEDRDKGGLHLHLSPELWGVRVGGC